MSHAFGEVWSLDGKLQGYYEYNGTADVACTRIFHNEDDLIHAWRKDVFADCSCNQQSILVILYTEYGRGCYWLGKACLSCQAITEGLSPDSSLNGHPFCMESKITNTT